MAVFIDFFRNAEAQPPFTESQTITPAHTPYIIFCNE